MDRKNEVIIEETDFTSDDREILEDALMLAINEVTNKVTEDKEGLVGDLAGSLNIPGLGL